MSARRKTVFILVAAVLLALLAWRTSAALRMRQAQNADGAGRPLGAIVQTARAQRATLEQRATHVGEVLAESSVDVTPRISAMVADVPVAEGQTVVRGQLLVRLDAKDLRFQVSQAGAAHTAARVQVDAARASLMTQRARLAQVLAGPAPEQVRQAEEQVRQAQAAVAFSRQQVRRQEELLSQGYVAQQAVDAARLDLSVQETRLRSAEEALALLRREPRPEAVQIARAQVDEAEVAHRQAVARLEQARLSLRQAESTLADTRVIAPIDGVVGKRLVERGQAVLSSTALIRLIDVTPAVITIAVIERDLSRVRPGMPVTVTTDALPGRTFQGRVVAISPTLAASTRTAEVRIEIANPDRALRPGMFAAVEILLARRENVITVPVDAIIERDGGPLVFVIKDRTAQARPVQVGIQNEGVAEIMNGLSEGEEVAIAGHRTLRDGATVIVPGRGGSPGQGGGRPGTPGSRPAAPPARP